MTRVNPKLWSTERFIVEVPVCGPMTARDIRWALEQAIENGAFHHKLTKYNESLKESGLPIVQIGRVQVKLKSMVEAGIKKHEHV